MLFSFIKAWRVKRKLCLCGFPVGFSLYLPLRSGWSKNLRAIENRIFGIRSVERNMRPILPFYGQYVDGGGRLSYNRATGRESIGIFHAVYSFYGDRNK